MCIDTVPLPNVSRYDNISIYRNFNVYTICMHMHNTYVHACTYIAIHTYVCSRIIILST